MRPGRVALAGGVGATHAGVAQAHVPQRERTLVDRTNDPGVHDGRDADLVITRLGDVTQLGFDPRRRVVEDRRARALDAIAISIERAVTALRRMQEGAGE